MRKISVIIIIVSLSIISCNRRSSDILSKDEMISVLYDMHLAQTIPLNHSQFESYEQRDAIVNGVLKKHDITQADLDSSLVWYVENPKVFQEINDSVLSQLKNKKNFLQQKNSIIDKIKKDKADRLLPPYFTLDNSNSAILSFRLDSIRLKSFDMSNFQLSFDVQGLPIMNDSILKASIYYKYKDTTIYDIVYLNENKSYQLYKPLLPDSLLRGVSGFIHLDKSSVPLSVLLYNINYQDTVKVVKK